MLATMTSQEESERRFARSRAGGWTVQQIAGALLLVATVIGGGGWLTVHSGDDARELGDHASRIANNEARLNRLEQSGSPAVQAMEAQVKALEARLIISERVIQGIQDGRLVDIRSGVSPALVDDLKHRIDASDQQSQARDADLRGGQNELKATQTELRSAIDRLTTVILGQSAKPLVGPR
jgi:hypothetical protein